MSANEENHVRTMLESMGVATTLEASPSTEPGSTAATASAKSEEPGVEGVAMERRPAAGGSSRDMSLNTLVHLMGLSTASQVSMLEDKLDALGAKLSVVTSRLERLLSEFALIKNDASIDRIDFQLSDLRALLKRIVPAAAATGEIDVKSDPPKTAASRAKVLTSDEPKPGAFASAKPETKIVEQDQLEEFSSGPDEAAFQSSEGQRIRTQAK